MSMMDRGARDANMESAARAGYGKVAEQAHRIAELEAALVEMLTPWEIEDKTGTAPRPGAAELAHARMLVGHT